MQPLTSHNNKATAETNTVITSANSISFPRQPLLKPRQHHCRVSCRILYTLSILCVSWRPSARLTDVLCLWVHSALHKSCSQNTEINRSSIACSSSGWELWFWQLITRQIYRGGDQRELPSEITCGCFFGCTVCTRQRVAPLRFVLCALVTLHNKTLSATSGFTKIPRFPKPLLQASASDEPYMYLAPKQTALISCLYND
jgi:hypothetical protein